MSVRVPDERLDEQEACVALMFSLPHSGHDGIPGRHGGLTCIRCNAERALHSLVSELRADTQRIIEQQCAYRRVGAKVHHRVPSCGEKSWATFGTAVIRGEIDVLRCEPTDSRRCARCYSDAGYARHPL